MIVYVVPSELQPPVHPTMWRLPSTLNSPTIDVPLIRRCSPAESVYELAAKASSTGENEGADVVVVVVAADTVGELAGDAARTVTGEVVDGAPDDEPAHDTHVAARTIRTACTRMLCRRSEMHAWFHVGGCRSSVSL